MLLIAIAIIAVLALLFFALRFFFFRPSLPPPFEIRNFVAGAEIYSSKDNSWRALSRGDLFGPQDKIRTGPKVEVDLQIPDQLRLRLKENSQIEGRKHKLFETQTTYRVNLGKGRLLGSTEKQFEKKHLEIATPVLVAAVRGTQFQVESDIGMKQSKVEVLMGAIAVTSKGAQQTVVVKGLEKTEVKENAAPTKPVRITEQEWYKLKEAYDLTNQDALFETRQMDLSRRAGPLFKNVFDHGIFFTPNFGFAFREFYEDKDSKQVNLQLKYDVFPAGCYVGIYLKTRDLDISKFKSISFDARGDEEEGWPEKFHIEIKSKAGIIATFVPDGLTKTWKHYNFPINVKQSAQITEITFVIVSTEAGNNKKGAIYLRNISLD